MKASETTFQPMIEGAKQYIVPLFQRPYTWKRHNWDVLWEDLVYLNENKQPKSHFIGSIVTMPVDPVPQGVARFLPIDGQQRLTTIFILLALLRDTAKADGQVMLAEEIDQTMLVNPYKKGADHFKLMPTQWDRAPLQGLIIKDSPDPGSPLVQCYQFYERKLRQSDAPTIPALKDVIMNRLSVVSIVLDVADNPYLEGWTKHKQLRIAC